MPHSLPQRPAGTEIAEPGAPAIPLSPADTAGEARSEAAALWRRVAALADLVEGKPNPVTVGDARLALYRIAGVLHAVSDICTHEYVRLSGGTLVGTVIECPLHRARFDVTTGRCVARPAQQDIATYDVRIVGEEVFVRLEPA